MDICKLLGDPPIRDFFCLLWFCFLCGFVFHFVSKWFLLLFFVVCVVGLLLLLCWFCLLWFGFFGFVLFLSAVKHFQPVFHKVLHSSLL